MLALDYSFGDGPEIDWFNYSKNHSMYYFSHKCVAMCRPWLAPSEVKGWSLLALSPIEGLELTF